jgi:hypothetical protein
MPYQSIEQGACAPENLGHTTPEFRDWRVYVAYACVRNLSGYGEMKMKESKETKKTRNITFRLTDEEYTQVEKAGLSSGDDPNNWYRRAAISQSIDGHAFTKNERLLYQEIAQLRFLVGHGFKLLLGTSESTATAWKKITAQADQRSERIVEELLSRRE